ncbi:hypothetical protein [Choristoneura diversana nucleopolyhedrovirus]|nr:hypothetical protein [Choristoneura diversana nucleopolyhedrovirus]
MTRLQTTLRNTIPCIHFNSFSQCRSCFLFIAVLVKRVYFAVRHSTKRINSESTIF